MSAPFDFIGQGWAFPPTFVASAGTVELAQGLREIEQSLHILLTTTVGERLMRPDYGCDLRAYVFESIDTGLRAYLEDLVRTAIVYHEPRIRLERLDVTGPDVGGVVAFDLTYSISTTNTRHNYVFPFYLREGTNLAR